MRNILALLLLFPLAQLNAQDVSFRKVELKLLKKELKNNPKARDIVKEFESRAEKALTDAPDPIKLIQSQGLLMGNPAKMSSLKSLGDVNKIFALSLMYRLKGERKYLNKAVEFLKAWARENKPDGNPINETKLEDLVFGYDLIRKALSINDRKLIDAWLDAMATAEVNHPSGKGNKGTAVNNWNSHRIKMMTMINYVLKEGKYDKIVENELNRQLEVNLNPDGSTHDFYERDALNYHIFSVEPLLKTAIVIQRATGKNYFTIESSKGGSIKKSTDFLVPFMTGAKTHKEFQNSKVEFDRQRANNNEKGFIVANFIPSKGVVALVTADYFDPAYLEVIKKASGDEDYMEWQLLVNKVRRRAEGK
ncbi:alginate lyase family protein [Desertivirga arenae]|uniref:alginate lyase family protein n=1 Tax=Desertivirga arenae TaxID=2810309 RepID=UPI001A968613|nr:alginate lyase family protein [Pedobacter sp. SYSU D00823]